MFKWVSAVAVAVLLAVGVGEAWSVRRIKKVTA
jgi:hypothetical protein